MVSSAYLRLLVFSWQFWFQLVLHPVQHFAWCTPHIMLNVQGDNMLSWRTHFQILNQSIVPCMVLIFASWPAYRFLSRQVRWSGIPISLRIFHSLLWFTQSKALVNEAEVDVFLEFSCFFYDPTDVGNLITGSSTFLNPPCISGSSWFTYCWSPAWRILSITLLACEMSTIMW